MRFVSKYNLVPGPTQVSPSVLSAYAENLASTDLEADFFDDYDGLRGALRQILRTSNDVVIMSGEGMVVLWGAMKSVIRKGDRVVSVVNGLYGAGFADMARGLGASVTTVDFPPTGAVDNDKVIETIETTKPHLVTMVHCETPTGCLNDLSGIGSATRENGGLFLVDFVSSAGGARLDVDKEMIDLGLLGSQKVISAPPALAFATVSDRAWAVISEVGYAGYDALLPFRGMCRGKLLPYTHNWHAVAATRVACEEILREGIDAVQDRHVAARDACIAHGREIGLKLYNEDCPSPTVTAFLVPEGVEWDILDTSLRERGVVVGGSYGDMAGRLFRIGHMGTQANEQKVKEAMQIVGEIVSELKGDKA